MSDSCDLVCDGPVFEECACDFSLNALPEETCLDKEVVEKVNDVAESVLPISSELSEEVIPVNIEKAPTNDLLVLKESIEEVANTAPALVKYNQNAELIIRTFQITIEEVKEAIYALLEGTTEGFDKAFGLLAIAEKNHWESIEPFLVSFIMIFNVPEENKEMALDHLDRMAYILGTRGDPSGFALLARLYEKENNWEKVVECLERLVVLKESMYMGDTLRAHYAAKLGECCLEGKGRDKNPVEAATYLYIAEELNDDAGYYSSFRDVWNSLSPIEQLSAINKAQEHLLFLNGDLVQRMSLLISK